MFGVLKMSGAPPKAFSYYRKTKDLEEKIILEDLYKTFSINIKKHEKLVFKQSKLEPMNRSESIRDFRKRQEALTLMLAFEELAEYGNKKGYSEFFISMFYQKEISEYINR